MHVITLKWPSLREVLPAHHFQLVEVSCIINHEIFNIFFLARKEIYYTLWKIDKIDCSVKYRLLSSDNHA